MTPVLAASTDEIAARVFLAIAIVVVVARVMGGLARRIGQPAVIGEIVAGILLGPTLLGAFPGNPDEVLFPLEIRPYLKVVAELGLIIFMFIVGLELDPRLIRGKERLAGVVSAVSVALPFALGVVLAVGLYQSDTFTNGDEVDELAFVLFIGASMSVTAFPVLARILTERGMHRTEVGALALACAAVDDILAWSLLAVVIAIVESGSLFDLPVILGFSLLFVGVMFLIVKPALVRLNERFREAGRLTPAILSVILVGVLVSSFLTWKIGIHAIFGAFLFGVVMPKEDSAELEHAILERLESVSVLLLLPVFFIVTGLSVNIRGIGVDGLVVLLLILLVACSGKFFGAAAAARLQGIAPRKAAAVGILMNTRGLTELVILNVGLSAGVLTTELFTLLVIMAIVTTVMTAPLLNRVYPDAILERDIAEAERVALGEHDSFRVYVPLTSDLDDAEVGRTVQLAIDLADRGAELVVTRFVPRGPTLELGSGLGDALESMTSSMDGLHVISGAAEVKGVRPMVRSLFTDDPFAEVVRQAATVDADVILVTGATPWWTDGAGPFPTRLLEEGTADVARVTWPDSTTDERDDLVVVYGEDPDDGAAIELAARLARSRGAVLEVSRPADPGRRSARALNGLLQQLERLGVEVGHGRATDPAPAPSPARLRVSGASNDGGRQPSEYGGARMTVWARPTIDSESAGDRVGRLVASSATGTADPAV